MPDRRAYRQPQVGNIGAARTVKTVGGDTTALVTGDLALNKTVGLLKVPKGFVLTSIAAVVTDMDTNGSPALVFAIGDAVDDDRFITGATTAQAGGTNTTLAATGLYYEFTEETEINWKTTTAAATAAAGTVRLFMTGFTK